MADLLLDIPKEIATNLFIHAGALAPYLGLWFAMHLTLEKVLPHVIPGVYQLLNPSRKLSMATIAKDLRSKVICTSMAIWVVYLALVERQTPEYRALEFRYYDHTPGTDQLNLIAASYFIWDIVVCLLDKESFAFQFHAWGCFHIFSASLVRIASDLLALYCSNMCVYLRQFVDGAMQQMCAHLLPTSYALYLVVMRIAEALPPLHGANNIDIRSQHTIPPHSEIHDSSKADHGKVGSAI